MQQAAAQAGKQRRERFINAAGQTTGYQHVTQQNKQRNRGERELAQHIKNSLHAQAHGAAGKKMQDSKAGQAQRGTQHGAGEHGQTQKRPQGRPDHGCTSSSACGAMGLSVRHRPATPARPMPAVANIKNGASGSRDCSDLRFKL